MKNKGHIQEEVDKTLSSLDGADRAAPKPFLFTRVMSRLKKDEKNVWSSALAFISRPSVAFATIILAIFVNAVIYYQSRSESSQSTGEGEQLFANEYNLTANTIYDSTSEPE
jgi:hypothetical protein